ncbi:MAG TPA: hypothetical protein VFH22_08825 [Rhodocyclaceae bacterium]|nr:hypothetical protein [Rhodocyclaceae bacterium]
MNHRHIAMFLALSLAAAGAWAKLPPLSEEAKLKAEEAKVAAAEKAKAEGEQLAKAQDQVASRYIKAQKAKGITVKPTPVVAPAPAAPTAAPAAAAKK